MDGKSQRWSSHLGLAMEIRTKQYETTLFEIKWAIVRDLQKKERKTYTHITHILYA